MHRNDVLALLARIGGLSVLATDAQFSQYITTLFGAQGPKIVAVFGLISVVAADVVRVLSVPTPSSGDTK